MCYNQTMRIERIIPKPPPQYQMTFSYEEGLTLAMALRETYHKYAKAVGREDWKEWADSLDEKLRSHHN